MIAEAAALALALTQASFDPLAPLASLAPPARGPALYAPRERAVSNWRMEAAFNLEASLARFAHAPESLPRCVRLNNYWCVKSARWSGEIAADREGHVAFASAREGAIVAAQLLRRYYVDLGRRNADSIVSRWAPAECGLAPRMVRVAGAAPGARARPDALSTRGVGNTLRARWLASRGKPGQRVAQPRPSRIAAAPAKPMIRAPAIAVGLGERPAPAAAEPIALRPVRLAALEPPEAARASAPGPAACPRETARLRAYAAKLAEGLAEGPRADLNLFDAAGLPTPALTRAMANMAAVEIGPLRAREALIASVVDEYSAALRAKAAAASAAQARTAER